MKYPFKQKVISGNMMLREFSKDAKSEELTWHRDHFDRVVTVESGKGWMLQLDNELPISLLENNTYFIPKNTYHRVLKGKTNLVVTIKEKKDSYDDVRRLVRTKLLENKTLNEEKLLTEIFGFLVGIGTLFLGLFGVAIAGAFKAFSGQSYTTAVTAVDDWAKSKGYSEEDVKPGGKHFDEASVVGVSAIVKETAGILPRLQTLDDVDPLPPLSDEQVGDEEEATKKYEEEMKKVSESAGKAAGELAGAYKAASQLSDQKKSESVADTLGAIKPTCAADVWHIAYSAALGLKALAVFINDKPTTGTSEKIDTTELDSILSWCEGYQGKFPDSKTPNLGNVTDIPSGYASKELAKAAKEVLKGAIEMSDVESWEGTVAHYMPAVWLGMANKLPDDPDERKQWEDESADGMQKLIDKIDEFVSVTKIDALGAVADGIIDDLLEQDQDGKYTAAEKHIDFMGEDTRAKYFFDPRFGDGWKNRIWAFALAADSSDLNKIMSDVIIPAANVPYSIGFGPGRVSKSKGSRDRTGNAPDVESLLSAMKPILEANVWLSAQGEAGMELASSLGLFAGTSLKKEDIRRMFVDNPETSFLAVPDGGRPEDELGEMPKTIAFFEKKIAEHIGKLAPSKDSFVRLILPNIMKHVADRNLVPNKELFNFILTGNADVKKFGAGTVENLSGATVTVESSSLVDRWATLAGIRIL